MAPPALEVTASMDRRWLEDQARHDPVLHAYALWDLDYAPDRVEFRVLHEGGVPIAYLLIWHGLPVPTVHWIGTERPEPLLSALPPRPLVAVVPESIGPLVSSARRPAVTYPVRLMARPAGSRPGLAANPNVRRLRPSDQAGLTEFAARAGEWAGRFYSRLRLADRPPVPETIWGAFDGDRLVGAAHTQVKLPAVWVITGIVVEPDHRGQGLGRDLTAAAVAEADAAGAHSSLYVRDDNVPAVRAYERVGFLTVSRRTWVDAGGQRAP